MTAQPTTHCPDWCVADHRTRVHESHAGRSTTVSAADNTLTVVATYLPEDDQPLIELASRSGLGPDQQTLVGLLTHDQAIELAAGLTRSAAELGGQR